MSTPPAGRAGTGAPLAPRHEAGPEPEHAAALRQAAAEAEAARLMLAAALDALTAEIAITDGTGAILAVNAAWKTFPELHGSGVGASFLAGCDAAAAASEPGMADVAAGFRDVRDGARESASTTVIREQNEVLQWYTVRTARAGADGSPLRLVVTCEDATPATMAEIARREAEQQVRDAQRMDSVGRLAGGIAHDFNNILTAIKGNAELLLGSPTVADTDREDVREIAAADRAATLTRQLLAFSRRQVLQLRVVSLNETVRAMEPMLRRLIGEDIELRFEVDPGLPTVRVDVGQMEQVVLNLVVNARDAMPRGGRITVSTCVVPPAEAAARKLGGGAWTALSISDTGTGVPPEVLPKIFDPFFTTKERGKGTGLGLSTVYGIVEQSGGRCEVRSTPGDGARFVVYLPADPAAVAAAAPTPGPDRELSGTEVLLLVEDEDAVRAVARRTLLASGYTVLEARTPAEALMIASDEPGPIHLMLTDVVMPGMSGNSLAEQVVRVHPETRVLFMSGYHDEALSKYGALAAGVPVVEKPFTTEELRRRVREMLDRGG